jgi:hypothetical protein
MHNFSELLNPYRVEISASAWAQLESLPFAAYRRIQRELSAIAEVAALNHKLAVGGLNDSLHSSLCFSAGNFVAVYRLSPLERMVTLLEITQRLGNGDEDWIRPPQRPVSFGEPTLSQENGGWVVTLVGASGQMQRYECATEVQAQNLVKLLRTPARPPREARAEAKPPPPRRFSWLPRLLRGD